MTAKLTFNDNFDSLNIWNGSSGAWSTNWWYNDEWGLYSKSNGSTLSGNAEQQWYINANYAPTDAVNPWSTSNGILTITAKPADAAIQPLINNYKYTSGMINTWHSFSQKYGYFEMRADLPEGQGLWPAFWLLPQDGSWPPELDIMEVLGNDPTRLYTTAHSNATGSHTMKTLGTTVADMSSGFHTYAVDWRQDKITWYFDGKQVFQTATPADMHKPMYMIANLAVGGYWPGSPDASTKFPAEFKIDYIRAYDSNPYVNGGAVASPTPPAAVSPPPPPPPPPAPAAPSGSGLTLTSQAAYSKLTGGSGADTLNAGQGADTLTGGAGADRFVIGKEPWAPIVITDFKVGEDKLDLSALFKASGYTGSDPVKDGYIHIVSDGAGGSLIRFDKDGPATGQKWPNTIIDIQNVAPSTVTWAKLTGAASAVTPTAPAPAPTASAPTAPSDGSSTTGKVLTATAVNSVLTGGAGADTITASMGFDTLTGGAGADRFVLAREPWAPIQIDDFKVGEDKLDLSGLFKASGYTGSDPVKDGYIHIISNGSGGSLVRFDRDGLATGQKWPNTIIELEHVAPSSVTWAKLAGSAVASAPAAPLAPAPAPTEAGATSGQTLKAAAPYATLTGGAGADTITASQGGDRLTGGAGADRFVFGSEPWAPIHVADFTPGMDKLDLSALFKKAGYTGKDPIADRYMYVESDGAGGSVLRFDRDAGGSSPVWPNTIIDLNVAPSQVKVADWIIA